MRRTMLQSKIHRARVSNANLAYSGSISIDTVLMQAAGLLEGQKVDVAVVENGERFSTYVIEGKSGEICLNGAAARKVQIGDTVIIMAYFSLEEDELESYRPVVVFVDSNNAITEIRHALHEPLT